VELGKLILEDYEKIKNHLDRYYVMKQELKKLDLMHKRRMM
jgi:hypothetical protein